jgi:phosphatidylserine decarboxylase
VHVNRAPVSGRTVFTRYHKGKYLVAWHPKSSTENERSTLVFETPNHGEVLIRQIAGAVARRIAVYVKPGQPVSVGEDVGFIRFGSRVDIFLPLDAEIRCKIGDKPSGGETVIAKLQAASK